jgi:inositol phosphorylceramide mannosyltransferase catalytic subunit
MSAGTTPTPKRILQTARSRELPLKLRAMSANLKLLNPDFEYVFFDDAGVERFIDAEFPQYRPVFKAFKYPIQRFDFFRYLAVYRLGGFYFALDVMLAKGLSELLSSKCTFPFEGLTFSHHLRSKGMDWQLGNYAFGGPAGHPFLKTVIENCVKSQQDPSFVTPMMRGTPRFSKDEFYVLNTTGPGLLSRTLAENPEMSSGLHVLFPDDVCDVKNWNVFGDFGVHLMEGTWRPTSSGFLRRRLAQRWEVWMMDRAIKRSRRLGRSRHLVPPKPFSLA